MNRRLILAAALATAATPLGAQAADRADRGATATMRSASGEPRGTVTFRPAADGVRVEARITGIAPGTYAAHIHMTGRCEAPSFESAGGHWNPTGALHGKEVEGGPHKGDLPNIEIGQDGSGSLIQTIGGISVAAEPHPILDSDGAAFMIHAKPDDHRSQPSGAAGERIACGVIAAAD